MSAKKGSLSQTTARPRRSKPAETQKGRSESRAPKTVGYARVSSDDQDSDLQLDALRAAGIAQENLFVDDGWSGSNSDRPGLDAALASLQTGDTLAVWKLDRLGRSLSHLVAVADDLKKRGIRFRSLTEAIDTETASGRMMYAVLGAVAAFERDVLIERTKAGMKAAGQRGVHLGRPHALAGERLDEARGMLAKGRSKRETARILRVSVDTLDRSLARAANG